MNHPAIQDKKKWANAMLFFLVMGLTFYTIFHGQDLRQTWKALCKLPVYSIGLAILNALFFVSAEGCMIFYLLRSRNGKTGLLRCISYSFIGFFYSGITPSATGGQPMQLYQMKKDGNALSDSTVVLMTVALIYKFVLVLIGIGILIFWYKPLMSYLEEYDQLFLLGLSLNILLVILLLIIMLAPGWMKKVLFMGEGMLIKGKLIKQSVNRREKINQFVAGYQNAVQFLLDHKKKVCVVILFTFIQRISVFFLTYIIYRGFYLKEADMMTIVCLQASIYIAVDMLPVPGAQGITELMYQSVFKVIFPKAYLMPSLYVTRGISFYFLLLFSLGVVLYNKKKIKKVIDKGKNI